MLGGGDDLVGLERERAARDLDELREQLGDGFAAMMVAGVVLVAVALVPDDVLGEQVADGAPVATAAGG